MHSFWAENGRGHHGGTIWFLGYKPNQKVGSMGIPFGSTIISKSCFPKFQLTRSESGENKGFETQVKQETTEYDNHDVFAAEGEPEQPPSWAKDILDKVNNLEQHIFSNNGEETDVYFNNQQHRNNSNYAKTQQNATSLLKCYVCGNFGHRAVGCNKRLCGKCGMKGHHEKNCYIKKGQERSGKTTTSTYSQKGAGLRLYGLVSLINKPEVGSKEVSILFDSGAGTSVMSSELFPELNQSNGTKVHGIGGVQASGEAVDCEISISSTWKTMHELKPMTIPGKKELVILGRDFPKEFGKTEFDWNNERMNIGEDWIFMVSENHEQDFENMIEKCKIGHELSSFNTTKVKDMLKDFCQVFVKNSKAPKICTTEVHRIFTQDEARIFRDKVRRLPMKWKGEIDRQINEMLENDIIQPSCSSYNSNRELVKRVMVLFGL